MPTTHDATKELLSQGLVACTEEEGLELGVRGHVNATRSGRLVRGFSAEDEVVVAALARLEPATHTGDTREERAAGVRSGRGANRAGDDDDVVVRQTSKVGIVDGPEGHNGTGFVDALDDHNCTAVAEDPRLRCDLNLLADHETVDRVVVELEVDREPTANTGAREAGVREGPGARREFAETVEVVL